MAHIADGADVAAALDPPAARRRRDPRVHGVRARGSSADGRPDPAGGPRRPAARRPVRRRPRLRQLLVGRRPPRRWPRASCPDAISTDLHRYSIERPVVDLPTTMSRYPRPRAVARRGRRGRRRPARRRSSAGPSWDAAPRRPGRRHASCASTTDAGRPARFRGRPPDRPRQARAGAGRSSAACSIAPSEVELGLRPYLDADREVDCSVPI